MEIAPGVHYSWRAPGHYLVVECPCGSAKICTHHWIPLLSPPPRPLSECSPLGDDDLAISLGPGDLKWNRADMAAGWDRLEGSAREFIAAGVGEEIFLKWLRARAVMSEFLERAGLETAAELAEVYQRERERLFEPNPHCPETWRRKLEKKCAEFEARYGHDVYVVVGGAGQ
jgi:hypothetical protein